MIDSMTWSTDIDSPAAGAVEAAKVANVNLITEALAARDTDASSGVFTHQVITPAAGHRRGGKREKSISTTWRVTGAGDG